MRLFTHRVAMLQQFATGKVNFPHRTFQEYLAAQEALSEGQGQLVVDNAEKEQWREVAILAVTFCPAAAPIKYRVCWCS